MRAILLAMMICVSCGDSTGQFTKGDVAQGIAEAYCDRTVACGNITEEDYTRCYLHNVSHLCELEETCGLPAYDGAEDDLDQCVAEMPKQDCILVLFGGVPESCTPLFD